MHVIHTDQTFSRKAVRSVFWTIVHLLVPRLYAFTFVHCVLVMEFSIKTMRVSAMLHIFDCKEILVVNQNMFAFSYL